MDTEPIQLLLADDDHDDCFFFKEALEELPLSVSLTTVHNGEQLMLLLNKMAELPAVLFLDLNMPRKNGFECLVEIKQSEKFKTLPVIIYSTSFEPEVVNLLYNKGAQYYICKPAEFTKLKQVIHQGITKTASINSLQPDRQKFILQP